MIFALWLACVSSPAESAPIPLGDPTPEAVGQQPAAEPIGASCSQDADCAVVLAIDGLDHVPADAAAVTCGDLCYVAIAKGDVDAWESARQRLQGTIPCDKKQGKCGDPAERNPRCLASRCAFD